MEISDIKFPKKTKEYTLPERLLLFTDFNYYIVPAGTKVRIKETQNFGVLSLPEHINVPQKIWTY